MFNFVVQKMPKLFESKNMMQKYSLIELIYITMKMNFYVIIGHIINTITCIRGISIDTSVKSCELAFIGLIGFKFDAFGDDTMSVSLLQSIGLIMLTTMVFFNRMECKADCCFGQQILALFWYKSDTKSVYLAQIVVCLTIFECPAFVLTVIVTIYAICTIYMVI